MSRYVRESTPERSDAAAQWGVGDLRHRPAPVIPPSSRRNSVVAYDFPIDQWTFDWSFNELRLSGYSVVTDATYPLGKYFSATADGSYFTLGFPLGPKTSRWGVNLNVGHGPDHGIIVLEWAQTAVRVLAADSPSGVDEPELLYGPEWVTTWYRTNNADSIDLYNATVNKSVSLRERSLFYISGADSTKLSANGSSDPFAGSVAMNGSGDGSHYWWLRILTSGKNPSSTGFKTAINRIRVTRVTDAGFQAA